MFKVVCFRWRERARSNGKTAPHIDREAAIEKVRVTEKPIKTFRKINSKLAWLVTESLLHGSPHVDETAQSDSQRPMVTCDQP